MNIYEDLGVRTLVNASGTLTRNGGSVMAPEVLQAMAEAAQHFCRVDELQAAVGKRIADMLKVPAAYVCASASSGLVLTAAACMAGAEPERVAQLPDIAGMRHEILVQSNHRIPYDQALRLAGATLVEIADDGTPPVAAMTAAINERTAAIFYLAIAMNDPNSIPLDQTIELAHAQGIPVIIDAASECPPLSTLTRFCDMGADLVIFSGGKSIAGPQSSGLIVGRSDLIEACAANGCPFAAVGRPMKISREEIVAFMKALELYLSRDHAADMRRWEAQIRHIGEAISDLPHIQVNRYSKGETYQVPMLQVDYPAEFSIDNQTILDALLDHDPPISVRALPGSAGAIVINPHNLAPGQEEIVAAGCREVLGRLVSK